MMAMPVGPRPAHENPIDEQGPNGIRSRDDYDHGRPIEVRPIHMRSIQVRPAHDDDTRQVRPRDAESDRDTDPRLRRGRGRSERGRQSDYQSDLSHRSPPERRPIGRVVPRREKTA
jgi:hypothetical protein